MRTRWEESGEADLDAPATLSERDLRSLRRRAGLGPPAVILALLAVGGLAWTLIAGPQGLEQIQRYKERALYRMTLDDESAPPAEAAPASAAVPVTDSLPPPPAPPDSMKTPPPTPAR